MTGSEGETRDSPRILGYEIIERAGRSAFGVCYRARQVSMDRVVTVKVVPASRAVEVRRLRREIQLLVRLAREELVGSIDEGKAGDLCYFVHERPEGETLEALAGPSGIAWREAVALGIQLAQFLDETHREGIALRELHPASLIRTPDGRWRVASLEMAAPFGSEPEALRTLGPPSFIAPELLRKGAKPTVGSDLFSLGAIVFFAATGRAPFAGSTVAETLESIAKSGGPESIAERRGAPRDLDRVLAKLLATAPEVRYPSGRVVRADLERIGRGRTIERRRPGAAGWLVASAVAIVLVGVACWLAFRPKPEPIGKMEPGKVASGKENPPEPVIPTPVAPKEGGEGTATKDPPEEVRAWREASARIAAKADDPCADYSTVKAFLDAYPNGAMAEQAQAALQRAKEACDEVTVRDFEAVKAEIAGALLDGRYGEVESRMDALAKRHDPFEGGALALRYVEKARAQCKAEAERGIEKARALADARGFDEALALLKPLQERAVASVKPAIDEAIGTISAARDRRLADEKAFAEARAGAVKALRERRSADAAAGLRQAAGAIGAQDLAGEAKRLAERADAAARGWEALLDGIDAAKARRKIHYREAHGQEAIEIDGEIRSRKDMTISIKRWERTEEVTVPILAIDPRDLAALAGAAEPGLARADLGWALCFGGAAEHSAGLLLDGSEPAAEKAPVEALIREFLGLQDREAMAEGLRAAEESAGAGGDAKAEEILAALIVRYGKSPAYAEAGRAVEELFISVWIDRGTEKGLGGIANGKVIPGKDGTLPLTLRYDFEERGEELDWSPAVRREVTNGLLSVIGRTVLLQGPPAEPGLFRGSIKIQGRATPKNQHRPNVNVVVWARPKPCEILFGLGYQPKLDELKLLTGEGFVSLPANVVLGIEPGVPAGPKATVIGSREKPRLVADNAHEFAVEATVDERGTRATFSAVGEIVFSGNLVSQFPAIAEGTPEGTIAIETFDVPVFFDRIQIEGTPNPAWLRARLRARAGEALSKLREKASPR